MQWTGISLVCFRPACILLACVGFGQETRANAPSPTSNGCQAPLNVMGWLESWRRWEEGGREGDWGVRSRGLLGQREKSSHTGAGLWAYQCVLDLALPRLLRQTRCSVGCSVPLCVRYSLGQPAVPWYCRREATVQFKLTADGPDQHTVECLVLQFILLTASFKKGSMVSLQLLTQMDFFCVLDWQLASGL